jgi:hypothetical protein
MTIENQIRKLLAGKLQVRITRRSRTKGQWMVMRPDNTATFHRTKKEALTRALVEIRCMNPLRWSIETFNEPR